MHCTVLHCGNVLGRNLQSSSAGVQEQQVGRCSQADDATLQLQSTVMSQANNLGHNEADVDLPLRTVLT